MNRKVVKELFDEEFSKIKVTDGLKRKTLSRINENNKNVSRILYLRNACAIFIVSLICFCVYYPNKNNIKSFFDEKDNMIDTEQRTGSDFNNAESINKMYEVQEERAKPLVKAKTSIMEDVSYENVPIIENKAFVEEENIYDFSPSVSKSYGTMAIQSTNTLNDNEILLEDDFLRLYPEAEKTDEGYLIIKDNVKKVYIFETGKLLKVKIIE